nr:MAG TPA: hypothetical protein [Caudoviricetes sp.]
MISCITKKPKTLLVSMARKGGATRLTNSIFSYLLITEPKKIKKRPRLMPRTIQTLIIILYHKGM